MCMLSVNLKYLEQISLTDSMFRQNCIIQNKFRVYACREYEEQMNVLVKCGR